MCTITIRTHRHARTAARTKSRPHNVCKLVPTPSRRPASMNNDPCPHSHLRPLLRLDLCTIHAIILPAHCHCHRADCCCLAPRLSATTLPPPITPHLSPPPPTPAPAPHVPVNAYIVHVCTLCCYPDSDAFVRDHTSEAVCLDEPALKLRPHDEEDLSLPSNTSEPSPYI